MRRSLLALVLLSSVAGGHELPPVAPPFPVGAADAQGQAVFVEGETGAVDAVELATGARRWRAKEGRWPLHATLGQLLVAAPDPRRQNVLRAWFLRPADGVRLVEVAPIELPGWVVVAPERVPGRVAMRFDLSAWAPLPSRGPRDGDPRAGWWRLQWSASRAEISGVRVPDAASTQRAEGTFLVDPATGRVEAAAAPAPPPRAPAKLPASFVPDRNLIYWSWSDHGSAWTSPPRPFWMPGGVQGFVARETQGARRVLVHRWRPLEPLPPLVVAASQKDLYPIVTLDGRYLILIEGDAPTLHDLARPLAGGMPLPPFPRGFETKLVIFGPRLYYVTTRTTAAPSGGRRIERQLVALDWEIGKERWRFKLRGRDEAPPVPGMR